MNNLAVPFGDGLVRSMAARLVASASLAVALAAVQECSAAVDDVIASYGSFVQVFDADSLVGGAFQSGFSGSGVTHLGIQPNGNIVTAYTTSGGSNFLEIYNGATLASEVSAPLGANAITNLAIQPNGNVVVSYSNFVEIYDATSLSPGPSFSFGANSPQALAVQPNGNVVVGYGSYLQIFDGTTLDDGVSVDYFTGSGVRDIAVQSNGDIIVAYTTGGGSNYFEVYDGSTLEPGAYKSTSSNIIKQLAVLPNNDVVVAYGSFLQTFGASDLLDGPFAGGFNGSGITAMAVQASGAIAVAYTTAGGGNFIELYDGATLAPGSSTSLGSTPVNALAVALASAPGDLPGDFNLDEKVDALDYIVWRMSIGTEEKYDKWRSHYGMTSTGVGTNATTNSSVPEPQSFVLLIAMFAIHVATAWRSRTR